MLACGIFCNYKAVSSELSSFFINNSLNQWRILKSSSSLCSCTPRSCSSCSGWLIPHHVSFIWMNLRVEFWEHRLQPANCMCKYKAHFLFYFFFFLVSPGFLVFFSWRWQWKKKNNSLWRFKNFITKQTDKYCILPISPCAHERWQWKLQLL